MTKDQLHTALFNSRPGAEWAFSCDDINNVKYEDLVWLDKTQPKPTAEELGF